MAAPSESIAQHNANTLEIKRRAKNNLPLPSINPFCNDLYEERSASADCQFITYRGKSHHAIYHARDTHFSDNYIDGKAYDKVIRSRVKFFVYIRGTLEEGDVAACIGSYKRTDELEAMVFKIAGEEAKKAYETARAVALKMVARAINRTRGG
jgi:hypothetical protein